MDLKKTSKIFSNRYSCGSSVSKIDGTSAEEIIVQGDVQDELYDYILEYFPQIKEEDIQMVSK